MAWKTLLLEKRDQVAVLTLNQPEKRNAMTMEMGLEFKSAIETLKQDREVRVLLITGRGSSFSAGGDLQSAFDQFEAPAAEAKANIIRFYKTFLSVKELEIPTIAALKGHTIGAALCLALACDMRVAAADTQMSMSFIKIGIHPGMGASYSLPRLVGTARAFEMCLTGDPIDAAEALRIGLVNQVVETGQLDDAAFKLALRIARNPAVPARYLKRSIYQALDTDLERALDYESSAQVICSLTEDMKEGLAAAREKRKPVFKGY
ncbi:MAG: enoyl-CoA hydratase/isomerase family protein [Firmicutes bacterium]|nr:enoyl-CoA hydratase/isomerase family protein [Bacillota bacterium]